MTAEPPQPLLPTYDGPEVVLTHQIVVRGHSPGHLERSEGVVVPPAAVSGGAGGVEGAGVRLTCCSVELAVVGRLLVRLVHSSSQIRLIRL